MSFAMPLCCLPKISGKLAHVDLVPTQALADRVARELNRPGMTHEKVRERKGPSSPTLTKIVGAEGPISPQTVRSLEQAFDWPSGMVAALCGDVGSARASLGWSVPQLAERLGVSEAAVTRWEAGRQVPATVPAQLADIFDGLRNSGEQTVREASNEALLEELLRRVRANA